MRSIFLLASLIFVTVLPISSFPAKNASDLNFTDAEKAYLQKKKFFTMVVDPNWMPIESINENGKHVGISAEFFKLISKRIGVEIRLVPTKTWSESLLKAQQRKADILSFASETSNRRVFWNFTETLLTIETVIVTLSHRAVIEDISEVMDKPLGIMWGYSHVELLRKKYPEIHLIEVDSYSEGFNLVQLDTLYGMIGNMAAIGYYLQQERINNLKISGKVEYGTELKIALRNDDEHILSIFNKAVSSITDEEKQHILNNWLSVRYEHSTDYSLFFKLLFTVLTLAIIGLVWFLKLRQLNKKLNLANAQLEEVNKQKDYLFSIIGHDLRNPFMSILGFSSAIRDEFDGLSKEQIIEFSNTIHYKSEQILTMLNQLLDWSRLELKQIKENKEWIDLHKVVDEICEMYDYSSSLKNITIKNSIPVAFIVETDIYIVSTILRNFINNAIKFSHPSSTIQITFEDADCYKICVIDSGVGMDKSTIDELFSFKAGFTKKGTLQEEGTGLGLLICNQLSEIINAKIHLKSRPNEGTTVELCLKKD